MNKIKIVTLTIILIFAFISILLPNQVQANINTVALINIDCPEENNTCKDSIYIQGWVMCKVKEKTIKVYIDSKDVSSKISLGAREDVIKAIQGYGTKKENPTPGFFGTIDISDFDIGLHTLTIKVMDGNKQLAQSTRKFMIKQYDSLLQVDYPINNKIEKNTLLVQGWLLSDDKDATVQIELNGKIYTPDRQERQDVLNAIKGYGGSKTNKTPGYKLQIDISDLEYKTYKLKIKAISTEGKVLEEKSVNVIVKPYDSLLQVDYPINNEVVKDTLLVQGWLLSEDKDATIQVELNGKIYTPDRQQRQDVLNAIKGYGGSKTNKTPGYKFQIDISDLEYKTYKLKIKAISIEGKVLEEKSVNIIVKPYDSLLQVDYPINNEVIKDTLLVQGWLLSEDKDATIQIELNGKTYTPDRQQRQDVLNIIKGYGGSKTNKTPGYKFKIDISDLKDGIYDLKVIVYSKLGLKVKEEVRKITIKKYNTYLNIDYPETNKNYRNTLYIQGWDMSEQKDRKIEIYIDNENVSEKINREKRDDVLAAIKGYGDKDTNPLPGFNAKLDISKYSKGEHNITVKSISTLNDEVLTSKTIKVTLNKIDFETGVYGYSGLKVAGDSRGSDLKYYKVGHGENVFFGVFAMHGFEDAFPRDGTEISIIAENFVNKLLSMQDDELADNWTIYIFPDVNTDGRNYGWTNNGEGRTTLYSAAPNNKGVDINRCWPEGFHPLFNDRNFTGLEPLLAYEARYLKEFLLTKKSATGQTILIDLHGWTTQVIGDSDICNYYSEEFPENKYTNSLEEGYLINWARKSLGNSNYKAKSALIELPEYGLNGKKISGHQDVVDSKYSDRYIQATLNMLRDCLKNI